MLFSDLEGRLRMLDYDKKFLQAAGQLDVRRSSIHGFTAQRSDLRLGWIGRVLLGSADYFGAGKCWSSAKSSTGRRPLRRRHRGVLKRMPTSSTKKATR